MSEWITDRRPTAEDAYYFEDGAYVYVGYVWVTTEDGNVRLRRWWDQVGELPWMPRARPEPYVNPRRFYARWDDGRGWWMIERDGQWFEWLMRLDKQNDEYREAAERIAVIYEEVMP